MGGHVPSLVWQTRLHTTEPGSGPARAWRRSSPRTSIGSLSGNCRPRRSPCPQPIGRDTTDAGHEPIGAWRRSILRTSASYSPRKWRWRPSSRSSGVDALPCPRPRSPARLTSAVRPPEPSPQALRSSRRPGSTRSKEAHESSSSPQIRRAVLYDLDPILLRVSRRRLRPRRGDVVDAGPDRECRATCHIRATTSGTRRVTVTCGQAKMAVPSDPRRYMGMMDHHSHRLSPTPTTSPRQPGSSSRATRRFPRNPPTPRFSRSGPSPTS